jgi:two-component system sensor histidine kinase MprB
VSLRARIAAVASLCVALAVLAAAIGLYAAVRSDLRGEIDSALRNRAHGIAALVSAREADPFDYPNGRALPAPAPGGFPGRVQPAPFGAASGYVELIDSGGQVFVPGGQGAASSRILPSAEDRRIASAGSGSALSDRRVAGTELRVLTLGTGRGSALLIARPLSEVEHELGHLLLILVLIGGAGIALAAVIGMLVARTALAPVARFTRDTEELTDRMDLSRRLEVRGRDELARLAESFNGTLDVLERSIESQRHLVADASHELRTPIASLRANIQILEEADRLPAGEQASLREDIVAELDELTALVGDLVELARGSDPPDAREEVRLDELIGAAVQSARRRSQLDFALSTEPTLVSGRAERIGRAVSNLLDNARKWSPEGGRVEVELKGGVLSVRDHGPGFQDEDLSHVFDRFYRAPGARGLPGSGLGLAIVRQAAEAGGGFAEAANAPGGGALLRVGFGPVLSAPAI